MTIAKDAVIKAVLSGMTTANSKFERWSKGSWVGDYGVEGFMVAHIAAALRKEQDECERLLLEATFKEIIQKALNTPHPPGSPRKALKDRDRADITLFDQDDRTVHVIEVKRKWEKPKCLRDIKRLLALLDACAKQRSGSLKYGFLALPIVESATTRPEVRGKIRAKARRIEKEVRTEALGNFRAEFCLGGMRWYPKSKYYDEEKEYALAPFCLTFSN